MAHNTRCLSVYVSEEDYLQWKQAARENGIHLSTWVRGILAYGLKNKVFLHVDYGMHRNDKPVYSFLTRSQVKPELLNKLGQLAYDAAPEVKARSTQL